MRDAPFLPTVRRGEAAGATPLQSLCPGLGRGARRSAAVGGEQAKGVPQVVLGHASTEGYAGLARGAVVQPGPQPRVDDLGAQVVGSTEVVNRVEVAGRAVCVEPMDIHVDPV